MTDFGLYIRWDGDSRVEVRVTADYKSRMCGLCGNYNGDGSREDELKTPDGIFVSILLILSSLQSCVPYFKIYTFTILFYIGLKLPLATWLAWLSYWIKIASCNLASLVVLLD